jgi:hypothetical protein
VSEARAGRGRSGRCSRLRGTVAWRREDIKGLRGLRGRVWERAHRSARARDVSVEPATVRASRTESGAGPSAAGWLWGTLALRSGAGFVERLDGQGAGAARTPGQGSPARALWRLPLELLRSFFVCALPLSRRRAISDEGAPAQRRLRSHHNSTQLSQPWCWPSPSSTLFIAVRLLERVASSSSSSRCAAAGARRGPSRPR